ncbi:MAG: DUF1641 domain-containing protein [Rhodospirillales bacterium]|nr:DUF1641 domain-containing protein [Rhodospirillales bacterium]
MDESTLDAPTRAAVERALASLVESGDLDRLVALARIAGGAADALSDDIVARLAGLAADALVLIDRATRTGLVTDLLGALDAAAAEARVAPRPAGGIGGLWQLLRQPETQAALGFAASALRRFQAARSGGLTPSA